MKNTLQKVLWASLLLAFTFTACKKQDVIETTPPQQERMLGAIADKPEITEKLPVVVSPLFLRNNYEMVMKGKPAPKNTTTTTTTTTDSSVTVIQQPTTVPASYFLAMPAVQNQGQEGSCVAFASMYVRSKEWNNKTGATSFSYGSNIFSPEFIYNQIKVGDCSQGSSPYTALQLLQSKGVCTWSSMPYYDNNGCALQPTSTQLSEAANYRISSFATVMAGDQSGIKSLLLKNKPLMMTANVDQGFYNAGPSFIWSGPTGSVLGGHAITVCGFDDAKKAYRIINSWGTLWGDAGYTWISYNYFPLVVTSLYVMNN